MMMKRPALFAILALASCGSIDPLNQQTVEYVNSIQPILIENGVLAEQVLLLAADVHDAKANADEIATTWSTTIVPLSHHLHHQASFVTVPADFAEEHKDLVEIWSDRADAYGQLSEALRTNDTDEWRSAREHSDKVKLREEEWFRVMNRELGARGFSLDPFPG